MEKQAVQDIEERPIDWYGRYVIFEDAYNASIAEHMRSPREREEYLMEHGEVMSLQEFATYFYVLDTHERDQMTARWRDGHDAFVRYHREPPRVRGPIVDISPIREGYETRYRQLAELKGL